MNLLNTSCMAVQPASSQKHRIRENIIRQLSRLGVLNAELPRLQEVPLRDGDELVAMVFRAGDVLALWNVPQARIRFYDSHLREL